MHTISTHARQVTRWRWVGIALLVILAQAVVAVAVRSGDSVPAPAGLPRT